MSTDIRVYHADRIGGCITVISTLKTKIVIDFGEALPGTGKSGNLKFNWNTGEPVKDKEDEKEEKGQKVDAVFFTHYHGDHIGRLTEIPSDIPVFMGKITYEVIGAISDFTEERFAPEDTVTVRKCLRERERKKTLFFVEDNKEIKIPGHEDMIITPFDVDHSAYDAYMYLVETLSDNNIKDKTILHTGDYRDHGYKGHSEGEEGIENSKVLEMVRDKILLGGKRKVDVLLTEGTMIGPRSFEEPFSEKKLEKWAEEFFKRNKYVYLMVSSANRDSLANFYKAAEANHMAMYGSRFVLTMLDIFANGDKNKSGDGETCDFSKVYPLLPNADKPGISENCRAKSKGQRTLMKRNGFVIVVGEGEYYEQVMSEFDELHPKLIFSKWRGYLDKDSGAYKPELARMISTQDVVDSLTHTSGHAYPELVKNLILTVAPTELIWPIHTENPEDFFSLYDTVENRDKARELKEKTKFYYLTPEEKQALFSLPDKRNVRNELFNAFVSENGKFRPFYDKVCEKPGELVACFRGNGKQENITIYHFNHMVFDLYMTKRPVRYKVAINYDHARYLERKDDKLLFMDELEKIGFGRKDINAQYSVGKLICDFGKATEELKDGNGNAAENAENYKDSDNYKVGKKIVDRLYEIIVEQMMSSYFNPQIDRDCFKPSDANTKTKSPCVEKRWQQSLFNHYKSIDSNGNGLYVYDLEFSQAFPGVTLRSKMKSVVNEPDMLGIRFENGIAKALVLIEVKSTMSAATGSSGIGEHLRGMYLYALERKLMHNRWNDAREILKRYQSMGVFPAQINLNDENVFADIAENLDVPVERILLLTNANIPETNGNRDNISAIDYYKLNEKYINNLLKKYHTELVIAEGDYYDTFKLARRKI